MSQFIRMAAGVAVVLVACAPTRAGPLFGIDYVNGDLYQVSSTNAALTLVGNTGVQFMADIQFSPGGTLYGFTVGLTPVLYKIDPATAAATPVATLSTPGSFLAEGALTFAVNGTAYAMNEVAFGSAVSHLITINPLTGATTVVGALPAGPYDINGLAYRSDGMLVALDNLSNSLLLIDPNTLAVSALATLPEVVGGVGGMTSLDGSTGFFETAGPQSSGSNSLYGFDLYTGSSTLVGSFSPTLTDSGLSGLAEFPSVAAVPEPASLTMLAIGFAGLGLRVWRRRLAA